MAAKPWLIIPLVLPVGDKKYTIPPVDYTAGLELIAVLSGGSDTIKPDSPNETLFRLVMGPVWDQMIDDHLPYNLMFRAGMAATTFQVALVNDAPAADAVAAGEAMWESGVDPEAVAAAMAATLKPASKRSRSTASAPQTRPRASSRTTTSPKATRPAKASSKAPPSPGPR